MAKVADVKTGDILAWKHNRNSALSNFFITFIRLFTRADYGHVAVAIRVFKWVFVLEATLPFVKFSLLNTNEEVYHIPMDWDPPQGVLSFLFELIGLPYGLMDAIRAGLGYTREDNNSWQCAEIVIEFCARMGLKIDCIAQPDMVVKEIMAKTGKEITLLEP